MQIRCAPFAPVICNDRLALMDILD